MTNPPERIWYARISPTVYFKPEHVPDWNPSTEYIRADLFTTLQEQYDKAVALSDGQAELNDALQAEVDELKAVVKSLTGPPAMTSGHKCNCHDIEATAVCPVHGFARTL